MSIDIVVPAYIKKALDYLTVKGFSAYVVGGCIRDSIIKKIPNDWDICTNAKPDEIITCFNAFKVIETGLSHGTVTVIIDHNQIEITTFRTEDNYKDHRHPDKVCFTDKIIEDLARRDFTMNSLAYCPTNGLIDPFGGVFDIYNKIIKAVGEPYKRFDEDSLRILRAIRFSSSLGFAIEDKTLEAINQKFKDIRYTSTERQREELFKLLCGDFCYQTLIKHENILCFLIPEIINAHSYKEIAKSVSCVKNEKNIRFAALLSGISFKDKSEIIYLLKRLKFDNNSTKYILTLITTNKITHAMSEIEIKQTLKKVGESVFKDLINLSTAYNVLSADLAKANLSLLEKIISENQCYSLKSLEINGEDLVNIGFSKNKNIGITLNRILDLVINEKLENNKNIILSHIKETGHENV
ncbi:MAG: CCA tRNA nucleotidyltransferase [Clostridia bacterium]